MDLISTRVFTNLAELYVKLHFEKPTMAGRLKSSMYVGIVHVVEKGVAISSIVVCCKWTRVRFVVFVVGATTGTKG